MIEAALVVVLAFYLVGSIYFGLNWYFLAPGLRNLRTVLKCIVAGLVFPAILIWWIISGD